jgi:hypothetical protein
MAEDKRRNEPADDDGALCVEIVSVDEETAIDMWPELEVIGRRVDKAYPANHRMRKVFFPIVHPADHVRPTFKECKRARATFYGLPVKEQERILNGWTPWGDRHDYEESFLYQEVADRTTNEDFIARVLLIDAHGDDDQRQRNDGLSQAHGGQSLRYCQGTSPVEVAIKEGTSKEEAIQALEAAIDLIRREWGNLISKQCRPFRGVV